ncbi:hypothetical protein BDN72DRAFT_33568 [Pluteus cervinus]|uniref:Uncharacterized protein n=1 Tax=Pluteus cervinus TaxID=181527 RepID=A0ACD3BGJ2_9AGAR|nr:hypothetical protein BDN72DRAFT_33568 [Pluteus cervinus]
MQAELTQVEVTETILPLSSSSSGRSSGKPWKTLKTATVRSFLPEGVKTKKWEDRMEKLKKEQAIQKLQTEMKEEKESEMRRFVPCSILPYSSDDYHSRREVTQERKKAAEERRRLEELQAKVCYHLRMYFSRHHRYPC